MFSVTPIDRKPFLSKLNPTASPAPRVLAVVAHPDDEYHFAVTFYRLVREFGGIADQVIITDGAGGHRYSSFAEQLYGLSLSGESLRDVRRAEAAVAGRVLGIRQHFFLDQPDTGFTLNQAGAISDWNHYHVTENLDRVLDAGEYDFVFILLPSEDTHGHHKAAALLTLEAVARLPIEIRPVVLAAEAQEDSHGGRLYAQLPGQPATRAEQQTFSVFRTDQHPADRALNYQIVANWVIAAHKSQGLFQMEAGRHGVERFWVLNTGHADAGSRAEELFARFAPTSEQVSIPA